LAIQVALVRSHVSSLEGQWEGAKDLQRSLAIQAALVRSPVSSLEGQWEGAKDLQRSLAIQAALVRSPVSSLEGQWEGAKDLQRSLAFQAALNVITQQALLKVKNCCYQSKGMMEEKASENKKFAQRAAASQRSI
jgi:hypothetical protein